MKQASQIIVLVYILLWTLISCGSNSIKKDESSKIETMHTATDAETKGKASNIFENTSALTSALSKNGIGELKEWSNPMELGWGSLTDYYQFGDKKDGVGMQNNICYYLEGDETTAKTLLINLNINNPSDKKDALSFLSDITEKTFQSLNMKLPNGLISAIKVGRAFKADIPGFITSVELDRSKIETWKVNIIKK